MLFFEVARLEVVPTTDLPGGARNLLEGAGRVVL
jgi:hypothetical protein